jgi:hypothetical protein
MDKNTKITFVGQPIFSQVLSLVDKKAFFELVEKNKSDRYYKEFKSWDHFVSLMFGILSRCDSLSEIIDGMIGMSGKLEYLHLEKVPAKSTLSDGMRHRTDKFFEDLYFRLVQTYSPFLSDSSDIGKQFKQMLLIDSTTIRLFSEVLKGVGRNRKDDGKKKGGAKVHMVIDAHQQIGKFIAITAARVHDKKFLDMIETQPHSLYVFDRAYNHYARFAKWSKEQVFFVTRKKRNAKYTVKEVLQTNTLQEKEMGVHLDQLIELVYKEDKQEKTITLRMVKYVDEQGRKYEFLTNCLNQLTAEEVAACYKKRWDIELLFKKLKQNFQLHYFYGENEKAIRTQIWCTLIVQLLVTVIQKQNAPKKAFSTVACTIRIHLISMLYIKELVKGEHRYYKKEDPMAGQTDLFGNKVPRRKIRRVGQSNKSDRGHQKQTDADENLNTDVQKDTLYPIDDSILVGR